MKENLFFRCGICCYRCHFDVWCELEIKCLRWFFNSLWFLCGFLFDVFRKPCKYFAQGACWRGDHCKFVHERKEPQPLSRNVMVLCLLVFFFMVIGLGSVRIGLVLLLFVGFVLLIYRSRFVLFIKKEIALMEVDANMNMSNLPG